MKIEKIQKKNKKKFLMLFNYNNKLKECIYFMMILQMINLNDYIYVFLFIYIYMFEIMNKKFNIN